MLEGFVDSAGFTSDEDAARRALADRELDIVVIFPDDPLATVLGGERAEIEVLHDKIDPIQEVGVECRRRTRRAGVNASCSARSSASPRRHWRPSTAWSPHWSTRPASSRRGHR